MKLEGCGLTSLVKIEVSKLFGITQKANLDVSTKESSDRD